MDKKNKSKKSQDKEWSEESFRQFMEMMKQRNGDDQADFMKYYDVEHNSEGEDDDDFIEEDALPVTKSEWESTNPVDGSFIKCGSDVFYARIATQIHDCFLDLPLQPGLPIGFLRHSAMAIAAYLEDLVSDLGVWLAVKKIYRSKYGAWLPFYDTSHDDYFNDDLNIEDVSLIIWINFTRTGQVSGRIFSPFSEAVVIMAEGAYDILVDVYDKAREATRIRNFIKTSLASGEYYKLRSLSTWIGVDFPLTAVPFLRADIQAEALQLEEVYEKNGMPSDFKKMYYVSECAKSWMETCTFAGCSAMEILAVMAEDYGYPDTARLLGTIVSRPHLMLKINGVDRESVSAENEVGEKFRISKDSFAEGLDFSDIKGIFTSLVKFGDSWQVNGAVNILNESPDNNRDWLELSFIPEEIKEKVKDFIHQHDGRKLYYCSSLRSISKLLGFATPKQIPVEGQELERAKNLLLYLCDDGSLGILPDVCQYFADPDNKFYRKTADKTGIESLGIIVDGRIPDDVAAYIQENNLLPHAAMFASQGKEFGKRIVQENIRFLMNFFRVMVVDPREYL